MSLAEPTRTFRRGYSLPGSVWTDERTELAKRMWAGGSSASEIAAEIGQGITRNAVVGKMHRMKLRGGRPPGVTPKAPRKRNRAAKRLLLPSIAPDEIPNLRPIAEVWRGIPFNLRQRTECAFIVDDPRADVPCCGAKTVPGQSWCPGHLAVVWPPVNLRRVR